MQMYRIVFCFIVIGILSGCVGSIAITPEQESADKKILQTFFSDIRQAIRSNNAEVLYHSLSRGSTDWIDDIRYAVDSEPYNFLEGRAFYEILCILALRFEESKNPGQAMDPVSIIQRTIIQIGAIRKNFIKYPLGEFRISRFSAEIGLKKAPNVPVFFFEKENEVWKFDIVRSLPIILLGAESIARQKRNTPIKQAVFLLEKMAGRKIKPEELAR
ncbi:MAG: hypothetical protein HQK83_11400 [Fibrobacteria bacterium]|nr:hypothetical protein [Fibrobacteria bacterium]